MLRRESILNCLRLFSGLNRRFCRTCNLQRGGQGTCNPRRAHHPLSFRGNIIHANSPGLILVPKSLTMKTVIDELLLIWLASEREYWMNQYRRLPI